MERDCPYCRGLVGPYAPGQEPDGWFGWVCKSHAAELVAAFAVSAATDEEIEAMRSGHAQCLHHGTLQECADRDVFSLIARIDAMKSEKAS